MKIVKHGMLDDQGGRVLQGKKVESPSGWSLRTLQGDSVVLGKFGDCIGRWSIHLVATSIKNVAALSG